VFPQKANCLVFVRIRKSGICFASKQNNEERTASFSSDGKKRFVGEIPGGVTFILLLKCIVTYVTNFLVIPYFYKYSENRSLLWYFVSQFLYSQNTQSFDLIENRQAIHSKNTELNFLNEFLYTGFLFDSHVVMLGHYYSTPHKILTLFLF
jgi:hypothetical protein